MAETPRPSLHFTGRCPDCGFRQVDLPLEPQDLGDDFDWTARDYDSLRRTMLEELAARFPERTQWTAGDLEVLLVEVLAATLDSLFDMVDRIDSEAFLETARRPDSVRRLLQSIGYDALLEARSEGSAPKEATQTIETLERHWLQNPSAMEFARRAGPRSIHSQRRMVTTLDHARRLEEHPLVRRAQAHCEWTGAWNTVSVAIIAVSLRPLDRPLDDLDPPLRTAVDAFCERLDLEKPDWNDSLTLRSILHGYVEAFRLVGHEVLLQDAIEVAIVLGLSIRIGPNHYQSEVRRAVLQALGRQPGGFFEPGRLRFGEDLHASDVLEVLTALDGVEHVCLNRFKRLGSEHPDRSRSGRIVLDGLEIAICDDDPREPARGYMDLHIHGGIRG